MTAKYHSCNDTKPKMHQLLIACLVPLNINKLSGCNTYGRRAFAMAAPATWNTLSDELRNPDLHSATFRPNLNEDVPVSTILGTLSALEALCNYALYKSTFTLHYITTVVH